MIIIKYHLLPKGLFCCWPWSTVGTHIPPRSLAPSSSTSATSPSSQPSISEHHHTLLRQNSLCTQFVILAIKKKKKKIIALKLVYTDVHLVSSHHGPGHSQILSHSCGEKSGSTQPGTEAGFTQHDCTIMHVIITIQGKCCKPHTRHCSLYMDYMCMCVLHVDKVMSQL